MPDSAGGTREIQEKILRAIEDSYNHTYNRFNRTDERLTRIETEVTSIDSKMDLAVQDIVANTVKISVAETDRLEIKSTVKANVDTIWNTLRDFEKKYDIVIKDFKADIRDEYTAHTDGAVKEGINAVKNWILTAVILAVLNISLTIILQLAFK